MNDGVPRPPAEGPTLARTRQPSLHSTVSFGVTTHFGLPAQPVRAATTTTAIRTLRIWKPAST